ncbi:MAG: allantoinase AllB [Spirochaetes bacterium]|jgi:allantoinase|nr:allantoinase AllB [Spirochaetota bacterium]
MAYELLIRGGTVVTAEGVEVADIGIEDGRIAEVAGEMSGGRGPGTQEIDARGLHVFPGVVDAHVHFNDPGRDHWEGAATGSAALAAGGGTVFIDMPLNSSPPVLDGASFDAKLQACEGRSFTDFALYGGLTPVNLDSMEELAERGVAGYKAFMCPSGIDDFQWSDDVTLYRGMEIAARAGLPVLLHAESAPILAALSAASQGSGEGPGAANAGAGGAPTAVRRFLDSRPVIAELEAINRALLFAEETGCRIHVVHITNRRGVELIRRAVAGGRVDASAETCPHYLFFTDRDMETIGARAKCAPPLREEDIRRGQIEALLAGEIDTVGSDHSPAPSDMKDREDFSTAWGGIPGAQTTLRTLLTVEIPPERIAAVAAQNPAERFGLAGKGRIEVGYDADLALVRVDTEAELTSDELRDRHRLSPYLGRRLCGHVERVLLRGREVDDTPRGRFLRPADARR